MTGIGDKPRRPRRTARPGVMRLLFLRDRSFANAAPASLPPSLVIAFATRTTAGVGGWHHPQKKQGHGPGQIAESVPCLTCLAILTAGCQHTQFFYSPPPGVIPCMHPEMLQKPEHDHTAENDIKRPGTNKRHKLACSLSRHAFRAGPGRLREKTALRNRIADRN